MRLHTRHRKRALMAADTRKTTAGQVLPVGQRSGRNEQRCGKKKGGGEDNEEEKGKEGMKSKENGTKTRKNQNGREEE